MATKRTNFSDAQKAEIYARDRATCCFTGANLWLLESPVRPGFEQDWVDHIKPSTRGGKSVISNGVCASATYNAKKRHNTSDSVYLFRSGVPTDVYFGLFGTLPEVQRERLNRLSSLRAYDWYFNRAIALVCIAFEWRCWKKYYQTVYKRDDRYWINAAYKKLCIYQELGRDSSLLDRGLATQNTVPKWLQLETVASFNAMKKLIETIYPTFRSNFEAWSWYFWDTDPTNRSELDSALEKVLKSSADQETLNCIQQDYQLRIR